VKVVIILSLFLPLASRAQTNEVLARVQALEETLGQWDGKVHRELNELLWFQRLGQIAEMDKVRFTGPPPRGTNGSPALSGSNQVIVSALTFLPRQRAAKSNLSLIVLAHGEIHGNVASDEEIHVVRELLEQGYAVIAPDYRGSSGYGGDYWRQIDYGGLEIEDVHAARAWMLDRYPQIARNRVAIVGWSHGGLIALLAAFDHPEDYRACYAGVPVSDLEERIRIKGKGYEALFSGPYHLGKTVAEDPDEYHRRSPAWNAHKLRTPLLIHANTSDEDVNILEVEKLINALQAAGKHFQYRIYTNAPGGHMFNRLDTLLAQESRKEIYKFLKDNLGNKLR